MQLRPYQTKAIAAVKDDWREHQDVLLVMATGGGKTQCFLQIAMDALDMHADARCLVLAHREELIFQPLERIRAMNPAWLMSGCLERPRVGVVMAGSDECDRQLTIATIQTLNSEKRLARLLTYGPIDYLIVDECHHACAQTYVTLWGRLRAANPDLRHLGVTATPIRADGAGLIKVYNHVSARITIADLVREHYLVQPRWLGISTGIGVDGVQSRGGDFVASQLAQRFDTSAGREIVVRAYQEYASGRRAIAFTASVAGAHDLATAFNAAGVSARAVDGTTPKDERRRIMGDFRAGRFQVLTNCQVATEGFDAPGASCILMCRPTKSDSLYLQCMGRGLRPAGTDPSRPGMAVPGEDCLILDFIPEDTRNIVMAGDVLGLPKEVVREVTKKQTDPGEVQAGFTFDGEHFDSGGTPLEIIARQLDYLEKSLWTWHRRGGLLTLGCGRGSDGRERILAIKDGRLWGIWRDGQQQSGGSWKSTGLWVARQISADDPFAEGERLATKYATQELVSKGRSWHKLPISEGQERFLGSLARDMKRAEIRTLDRGQAAGLITHYQALAAIARFEMALNSQVIEVAP